MDDELDNWRGSNKTTVHDSDEPAFMTLKEALEEERFVNILYFGGSNPGQERSIKPLAFFQVGGYPDIYVRAFCSQRNEERTFRLDKISIKVNVSDDDAIYKNKEFAEPKIIEDIVLEQINMSPGSKASQIASRIGIEKKKVNSLLHGRLKNKVRQDKSYRWWPKEKRIAKQQEEIAKFDTPLSQLCKYYLDCLSQDDLGGVSVFAESKFGDLDYVELTNMPNLNGNDPFDSEEGRRMLERVRRDRNRQTICLGYPTRLRFKKSQSGWEGFFVEPLFLFPYQEAENRYTKPTLTEDLPQINFGALKNLLNESNINLMEEAILITEELGFANTNNEQPELYEIMTRLHEIRPDWDWKELPDPDLLTTEPPLSSIREQGIYNRAVIVPIERSLYTKGLEIELGKLQSIEESKYKNTALGAWLSNQTIESRTCDQTTLLEVLPLNSEQRQAVRQALSNPLTVVTGPPGTGKSQVVTSILINAAGQGKTVLFASKNNKAVDVVEARVNALGPRPILLRLGRNEYQSKLAEYLVALLASTFTDDDRLRYEESKRGYAKLQDRSNLLDTEIGNLLKLRNEVDHLEQTVEYIRQEIGKVLFKEIRGFDVDNVNGQADLFQYALLKADRSKQPFLTSLFWIFIKNTRYKNLSKAAGVFKETAKKISFAIPSQEPNDTSIQTWLHNGNKLSERLKQIEAVKTYFLKLKELTEAKPFEEISKLRIKLTEEISEKSESLWKAWLRLQPARMTQEERRLLGDYSSLLQMIVSANETSQKLGGKVFQKYYQLFPKISSILSCWAVTSLSARGRIPFEPNFFDLLVIDEASQCDIASALPLLFRARNVVVIGDPKQLRHISTVSKPQDTQLLTKHELFDDYARWSYSTKSLFDLASSLCRSKDIVDLRDHHRSHAEIIEFSNSHFYEGKLRVATNYERLNFPEPVVPIVRWVDVKGKTIRPNTGGAVNNQEASAVVDEIQRFIVQGYQGSVGVVSPFRAQANRIRDLVFNHDYIGTRISDLDFLADTVHRFQGDERDVMIFSPAVSYGVSDGALGFLRKTPNLFNVAITRARAALIVVGDKAAALNCGVDYLAKFASYTDSLSIRQTPETQYNKDNLGPVYPPVSRPELVSDWERLFYKKLYENGFRPIPQYSVEKYILDFAIISGDRKLNIEIDGERYHRNWDGELCRRDQIRNHRLIELGWDIIRFWVYQIRDDLETCIANVRKWTLK
jgi:very-short-patch-repair endonuclease